MALDIAFSLHRTKSTPTTPYSSSLDTSNHHLPHIVEVRGRKQQFRFRRLFPSRSAVKSPVLLLLLLSPTPSSLEMSTGPIIRSNRLCSAPSAPWNFTSRPRGTVFAASSLLASHPHLPDSLFLRSSLLYIAYLFFDALPNLYLA